MNGSVLYMDSGINRGRGDATPGPPARGAGRFPLQRWFALVDFLPGGGACRDHMWSRDPIPSPARGHLYDVHFGYQEAVMDWPCKCLEPIVTDSPARGAWIEHQSWL